MTEASIINRDAPVAGQKPKSVAYLNLYFPTKSGGEAKLGFIGLSLDRKNDRGFLRFLEGKTDEQIAEAMTRMIIKFNRPGAADETEF